MEATRERIWHRGGEWRQRRGGKGGEADGAEAAERRKEVGMPGVRGPMLQEADGEVAAGAHGVWSRWREGWWSAREDERAHTATRRGQALCFRVRGCFFLSRGFEMIAMYFPADFEMTAKPYIFWRIVK